MRELALTPFVYVIDGDAKMRRSLHALLSTLEITTWPFACAADLLSDISSLKPAPILLSISSSSCEGMQLLETLFDQKLEWPVIVMTDQADIPLVVRVMKMGASELLQMPFSVDALHAAVRAAFEKAVLLNKLGPVRAEARRLFESLTPRETEVVTLLMLGLSNKVVAHKLSISLRTVEMHRINSMAKLKTRSISELFRLAIDSQLAFNP